jgi:hypothetical protein
MRKLNLAVALMFVGAGTFAGLARADKPTAISQTPAVNKLTADESPEIQHLRATRKHLNEAKEAFEKDTVDKANHRKEILDGIDAAIKGVDSEIDELLGK